MKDSSIVSDIASGRSLRDATLTSRVSGIAAAYRDPSHTGEGRRGIYLITVCGQSKLRCNRNLMLHSQRPSTIKA
jgi:hypothetical protein